MNVSAVLSQKLALHGGPKVIQAEEPDLFHWPIVTEEDEQAVVEVTRIAFAERDVGQGSGSLPVSETLDDRCFRVPYFKHDWPESIEHYAAAIRKVTLQADKLL